MLKEGNEKENPPVPGYRSIPSTMHPYNYCANNPVNFVDPLGMGHWKWITDPNTGKWNRIWVLDEVIVYANKYDYEDYGYFNSFDAFQQDPPQYGNEGKNKGTKNEADPVVESSSDNPNEEDREFAEFMKGLTGVIKMIRKPLKSISYQPPFGNVYVNAVDRKNERSEQGTIGQIAGLSADFSWGKQPLKSESWIEPFFGITRYFSIGYTINERQAIELFHGGSLGIIMQGAINAHLGMGIGLGMGFNYKLDKPE